MPSGIQGLRAAFEVAERAGFRTRGFLATWIIVSVGVRLARGIDGQPVLLVLLVALFGSATGLIPLLIYRGRRVGPAALRTLAYATAVVVSASLTGFTTSALLLAFGEQALPPARLVMLIVNVSSGIVVTQFAVVAVMVIGREHASLILRTSELTLTADELRATWPQRVEEQRTTLVADAQSYLEPTLSLIAQSAKAADGAEVGNVAFALQRTIDDRLRPLARSLVAEAVTVDVVPPPRMPRGIAFFPRRAVVREVVRPEFLVLLTLPIYVADMATYFGSAAIPALVAAALASYTTIKLLVMLAPARPIARSWAVLWAFATPFPAAFTAALVIARFASDEFTFAQIYVRDLGLAPLFNVVLAYVFALLVRIDGLRTRLDLAEQDLLRLQSILRRELLIARRVWGYHIHGTVQSLLSAALLSLQRRPPDWLRIEVLISTAEWALQEWPTRELDIDTVIGNLAGTWAGMCTVTVVVDHAGRRALEDDDDLLHAVNELLKEAVSNAVRHSGATSFACSITTDARDLSIDARMRPVRVRMGEASAAGMGSALFDELATEWALSDSRLTVRIPLAPMP